MQGAGIGYRGGSSSVSSKNARNHREAYSEAGRSLDNDFEYAGRRGQDRFDADVLPSESASNAGDSDEEADDAENYYSGEYQQQEPMYQERENQYQQQPPPMRQRRPQARQSRQGKTVHDRMHSVGQRLKRSQTAQGILDFLGGPLRSKNRHNQRAKGNHYYDGPASAERKQAAHEVALARATQREEAKERRAEKLEMRRRAQAEAEAARRQAAAMRPPEVARPTKQPRIHRQDQPSETSSSSFGIRRNEQDCQENGISSSMSSTSGLRPGIRPNNQNTYLQPTQPTQRKQQRTPARYDPKLGGYIGGSEVGSAVSGLTQTSSALGFKNPSLIYESSSSAGSGLSGGQLPHP